MDSAESEDTPDTGDEVIDLDSAVKSLSSAKKFFYGFHLGANWVDYGNPTFFYIPSSFENERSKMLISGSASAAVKFKPISWFALLYNIGVEYTYGKKNADQISEICNYYGTDCEKYAEEVELTSNWLSLYQSVVFQFTVPAFSKKIHLDNIATFITNFSGSDYFYIKTGSWIMLGGVGLSYSVAEDIEIGIKYERNASNNFNSDNFDYDASNSYRVGLYANFWLF